jgi:soluble lytic murein transglycosylase-like protein
MKKTFQFGWLLILAVMQLPAAEIANLRNGFNVLHERHESFGEITRLYLDNEAPGSYVDVATSQIASFEPAPPDPRSTDRKISATTDLGSIISNASSRTQIDADFIASVIQAESANNPRAVSRRGAQGLMQLMPQTAKNLGVENSFDPAENVDGGVRFLRALLLRYNGDAVKALAAYNAGPKRVQQFNGVPPYRETRAYITRVISQYNRMKVVRRRQQPEAASAKSSEPKATSKAVIANVPARPAGTE